TLDGIEAKMQPILTYARKLTEAPDSVSEADAAAVYAAGWTERALHDAIMVTATFNFMNRVLEGHGAHGSEAMFAERGPMIAKHGYAPLIAMIAPKG
ncbi:MAG: peroxidase, partial [Alphaproteobacteria bacterium HGW-Alphaproteobacteria-8]